MNILKRFCLNSFFITYYNSFEKLHPFEDLLEKFFVTYKKFPTLDLKY